eukprot:gnl/Chilomastix_cuspidata/5533.p1 GENE.gnl/Chilomastix_cuspidata/5533~~gnl/Chilomastix_cuspidata/5533.p1  ORF type:complete len:742 (+),score=241.69 gnl/Chilomastix_cuspidata/5533:1071-3296(+)
MSYTSSWSTCWRVTEGATTLAEFAYQGRCALRLLSARDDSNLVQIESGCSCHLLHARKFIPTSDPMSEREAHGPEAPSGLSASPQRPEPQPCQGAGFVIDTYSEQPRQNFIVTQLASLEESVGLITKTQTQKLISNITQHQEFLLDQLGRSRNEILDEERKCFAEVQRNAVRAEMMKLLETRLEGGRAPAPEDDPCGRLLDQAEEGWQRADSKFLSEHSSCALSAAELESSRSGVGVRWEPLVEISVRGRDGKPLLFELFEGDNVLRSVDRFVLRAKLPERAGPPLVARVQALLRARQAELVRARSLESPRKVISPAQTRALVERLYSPPLLKPAAAPASSRNPSVASPARSPSPGATFERLYREAAAKEVRQSEVAVRREQQSVAELRDRPRLLASTRRLAEENRATMFEGLRQTNFGDYFYTKEMALREKRQKLIEVERAKLEEERFGATVLTFAPKINRLADDEGARGPDETVKLLLKRNTHRRMLLEKMRAIKRARELDGHTFAPSLNARSVALAERMQRRDAPASPASAHERLFHDSRTLWQRKEELQNWFTPEHTFRPEINEPGSVRPGERVDALLRKERDRVAALRRARRDEEQRARDDARPRTSPTRNPIELGRALHARHAEFEEDKALACAEEDMHSAILSNLVHTHPRSEEIVRGRRKAHLHKVFHALDAAGHGLVVPARADFSRIADGECRADVQCALEGVSRELNFDEFSDIILGFLAARVQSPRRWLH